MTKDMIAALALVCASLSLPAFAGGQLSSNIMIDSKKLGYSLQFRAYVPEGMKTTDHLPTVYVTDGQWYIDEERGNMVATLDAEIAKGTIKPIVAIFIDSRNPKNLEENRRDDEFYCNPAYADFVANELVPTVESILPVSGRREDRAIMGVSFGGYNAACFGLMIPDTFAGIGMHSPANDKTVRRIAKQYQAHAHLPLKMYLSTGSVKDNTDSARKFLRVLRDKGYDVTYKEVPFGHKWINWRPLVDDLLITFFAP